MLFCFGRYHQVLSVSILSKFHCRRHCNLFLAAGQIYYAREGVQAAYSDNVQIVILDTRAGWAILHHGEGGRCQLLGICWFHTFFGEHMVHFQQIQLCRGRSSLILDGIIRPIFVIEEDMATLPNVYMPELYILPTLRLGAHVQKGLTAFLELVV